MEPLSSTFDRRRKMTDEKVLSRMAVASLVLGAVAFIVLGSVCAPLAIVFGIIALVKIKAAQGVLKGRGLAIAGVLLGCLYVGALVSFAVFGSKIRSKMEIAVDELALEAESTNALSDPIRSRLALAVEELEEDASNTVTEVQGPEE